jgi:hypothetical protein
VCVCDCGTVRCALLLTSKVVVRKNPVHVAFFVLCAYVIVALCVARMLLISNVVVRKNPAHVSFFVPCACSHDTVCKLLLFGCKCI